MNRFLKLSLLVFLSPMFLSNPMEGLGTPEPEQQIEELSVAEEISKLKAHKAALIDEIIRAEVQEIVTWNYKALGHLEDAIDTIINQLTEEDEEEELSKNFKNALIEPALIKIRNTMLLRHASPYIRTLLDDNIVKFCPLTTLKENKEHLEALPEENLGLTITDLPQEIIVYILNLGNNHLIVAGLKDIISISNTCKYFYMAKGIFIDCLKKTADQIILNKALNLASFHNFIHITQILILSHKVNINEKNNDGLSALINTIRLDKNGLELAEWLLIHGAGTEIRDEDGNTAFMHAIWHGNIRFVKLLLAHNANVNTTNNNGKTALQFAIGLFQENPSQPKRKKIIQLIKTKIKESSMSEKEIQN